MNDFNNQAESITIQTIVTSLKTVISNLLEQNAKLKTELEDQSKAHTVQIESIQRNNCISLDKCKSAIKTKDAEIAKLKEQLQSYNSRPVGNTQNSVSVRNTQYRTVRAFIQDLKADYTLYDREYKNRNRWLAKDLGGFMYKNNYRAYGRTEPSIDYPEGINLWSPEDIADAIYRMMSLGVLALYRNYSKNNYYFSDPNLLINRIEYYNPELLDIEEAFQHLFPNMEIPA